MQTINNQFQYIHCLKHFLWRVAMCLFLSGAGTPLVAAQTPALLPMKNSVPPGQVSPVDGVYTVSTLGKKIRIDAGRGYMIDPWVQALFWEVKTDMVTLKNFRRTGVGRYEADDLPMGAKVKFTMGKQGVLNGVVKGVKYKLIPISAANTERFTQELLAVRKLKPEHPVPPVPVARPQAKKYSIYVKHAWCTGKGSWMAGTISGNITLKLDAPNGKMETKNFPVAAICKKKKYKKVSYSYGRKDSKVLTITVSGTEQYNNLAINGMYQMAGSAGNWFNKTINANYVFRRVEKKEKELGRSLNVGEYVDTHIPVRKKVPDLYLTVRFKRVQ